MFHLIILWLKKNTLLNDLNNLLLAVQHMYGVERLQQLKNYCKRMKNVFDQRLVIEKARVYAMNFP